MSVFVKVCGLTRVEDVEAAIGAGADALGFVFAPSSRRLTPRAAAKLAATVPSRVLRVAVMQHPSAEEWQAVFDEFRPDVLQTDAEDFASLEVAAATRRWPVYREGAAEPPAVQGGEFVYEGRASGRGETVDWQHAARLARGPARMILAGGLGPDNVADAVAQVRPWGVDASSGLEDGPGQKDARLMTAFVTAAKSICTETRATTR